MSAKPAPLSPSCEQRACTVGCAGDSPRLSSGLSPRTERRRRRPVKKRPRWLSQDTGDWPRPLIWIHLSLRPSGEACCASVPQGGLPPLLSALRAPPRKYQSRLSDPRLWGSPSRRRSTRPVSSTLGCWRAGRRCHSPGAVLRAAQPSSRGRRRSYVPPSQQASVRWDHHIQFQHHQSSWTQSSSTLDSRHKRPSKLLTSAESRSL